MIQKYSVELVKEHAIDYEPISGTTEAYHFLKAMKLDRKAEEHCVVIAFDVKQNVVGYFEVSHGALASSIVDVRGIMQRLLLCNAGAFIFAHNHPSGNCAPSNEDVQSTQRLKECGEIMNIKLIDSIIVGDDCYYSFAEERRL